MRVFIANVGERDVYYNVGAEDDPNFCHFKVDTDDEKQVAAYLKSKNRIKIYKREDHRSN